MNTKFARVAKNAGFVKSATLVLAGLLCLASSAPQARSQDDQNQVAQTQAVQTQDTQTQTDGQPDPPSRVARLSFLDGTVSFQPGGQGDWGTAAKNRPVTVGDKLWSDQASRAELQVGQASIHVGSMTALSFLNLDENIMQVRIAEGSMNFRVRELREGDTYEVDTPNLAFTVKEAGVFRVDVSESGDATSIIAIRGQGEVTAGGKTFTVHPGDRAEFTGIDNPVYKVAAASPNPDGLDRWSDERDSREDNSASAQYVSRDIPGGADLDDNGSWSEQPEYGPVWYPNSVGPDWAPYSDGNWNYVNPWGWTWIGYEPWGFAPYHYGRWSFIGSRWGWVPGPIYARPFYGPAFVGFLGGPRFGIGLGFGGGFGLGVGWFPLGFHEPYYPGFRASRGFINNINVRNTTIRNVSVLNSGSRNFNYAYAHSTSAVTAASRSAFVGGQAINRSAAHVTAASLRGAEVSNRTSVTPGRQSSLGAANMTARATPSASVQNRSVMARTAPAAAASHSPVRTFNSTANRSNSNVANRTSSNSTASARQNQLSQGRPPSNGVNAAKNRAVTSGASGSRNWEAQGNSTDRGHAPQGFGGPSRPAYSAGTSNGGSTAATTRSNRPPWAGSSSNGAARSNESASGNRSYQPASRSYSSPRSSYPSSRSYSPAPSHSNSAPSHSSSGGSAHGGGSPHGGGGSHGGGHH
jgi:hypothetical protein